MSDSRSKEDTSLPPGQRAREDFPRFGLPRYANRAPADPKTPSVRLGGDAMNPAVLDEDSFAELERVEQASDFHCVTTWSYREAQWSGYAFAEVFQRLIAPHIRVVSEEPLVFRCRDGYWTALPLPDLLAPGVLLADRLFDEPLTVDHGAPLRLVAPAHYGYKNPKHIEAIELWSDGRSPRKRGLGYFLDHPRARVEREERGRAAPGRLLRFLYRPLIGSTVRRFRRS